MVTTVLHVKLLWLHLVLSFELHEHATFLCKLPLLYSTYVFFIYILIRLILLHIPFIQFTLSSERFVSILFQL